jgi:SAM-dependent methyltransferase
MEAVRGGQAQTLWLQIHGKGTLSAMNTTMQTVRSGAAAQGVERSAWYYNQARPEVAALVPPSCRRVLEVGCGEGELGSLLRARGHHVTGLELLPHAAERARCRLDRVVTADVERDGLPFSPESFNAIIFADVLEHLVDPWRVLREAVKLLDDDGVVVASIPNVQNLDVIRRLLRGRWDYRERGILDFGHLRFFTLTTIRALFAQADLTIESVGYLYRRTLWRELLCWLSGGWARGFWTRQYLIVARKIG